MPNNQAKNWQNILWREWRNCGHSLYAKQLYEVVADYPVGWGTKTTYIILDAIIGLVLGGLLGFMLSNDGRLLQQLATAGGLIGAAGGFFSSRRLTWRVWLDRLSFGLPAQQPSRGIAALIGLMLVGGMIFGPFLWLFLVSLFWGMSGLIKWMMRGLIEANPYGYHAWYVWWWRRPPTAQVEAALQVARHAHKPPVGNNGSHPLAHLTQSPATEVDFSQLEAYARHRNEPQF